MNNILVNNIFSKFEDIFFGKSSPNFHFYDRMRFDDIYLISFPRSGNTYLRYILTWLIINRKPYPSDINNVIPDIYQQQPPTRPRTLNRIFAKSHSPFDYIPSKIIYVVRDGRSSLLSYYYYLEKNNLPRPNNPAQMLMWDEIWPCTWSEHVRGWVNHLSQSKRGIIIKFEDLLNNPMVEFEKITNFAQIRYSKEKLKEAINYSSKENLRNEEKKDREGSLNNVGITNVAWKEVFQGKELNQFMENNKDIYISLNYN